MQGGKSKSKEDILGGKTKTEKGGWRKNKLNGEHKHETECVFIYRNK